MGHEAFGIARHGARAFASWIPQRKPTFIVRKKRRAARRVFGMRAQRSRARLSSWARTVSPGDEARKEGVRLGVGEPDKIAGRRGRARRVGGEAVAGAEFGARGRCAVHE